MLNTKQGKRFCSSLCKNLDIVLKNDNCDIQYKNILTFKNKREHKMKHINLINILQFYSYHY